MAPPSIKVRGAARGKGIPKGFILGRTSKGTGDVELLNLAELRKAGIANTGSVAQAAAATGFGFFAGGLPTDNERLGSASYARNVTFTSADPGSRVSAKFPAAASAVMNIRAPSPSTGLPIAVGTITFAAGSKNGVVAWSGGQYVLPAGTALDLYAPTPVDGSLADITGTVVGSGS